MRIKVKIIEKSKPEHPEEKVLLCAVPNENGMTKYFVMKVSNQTQIYKLKPRFCFRKPFPNSFIFMLQIYRFLSYLL